MTRHISQNDAAEQAEYWFVQLESGDATEQDFAEFERWLSDGPDHQRAYDAVIGLCQGISALSHLAECEPRSAKAAMNGSRRPALPGARQQQSRAWAGWRYQVAAGVFALLLLFSGIAAIQLSSPSSGRMTYATNIAEIREITLADGSEVTLGARSEISVRYDAEARFVTLSGGEAFFSVMPDTARPFIVKAGDTAVRVVGTKFNIHTSAENVTVAVLEGRVEVFKDRDFFKTVTGDDKAEFQTLTAGQKGVSGRKAVALKISPVEGAELVSWRAGQLVYDNASLSHVIADVNRYSRKQIRIANDAVGQLPVTASFLTSQIDQMVDGLAAILPVTVTRLPDGTILLESRDPSPVPESEPFQDNL